MSGNVPRIRRHVSVSLVLSLIISLYADADDVLASAQGAETSATRPALSLLRSAASMACWTLRARPKCRAAASLRHLLVMFGTTCLTGYLYYVIPKGFFPQQDTGMILGIAEAAQDISFPEMAQRMQALINVVLADPAVDSVGDFIGPGGSTHDLNQGRVFIASQAARVSATSAPTRSSAACSRNSRSIQGITLYLQAAQDITVGARLTQTQYQYTLTTPTRTNSSMVSDLSRQVQEPARDHRRRHRSGECRSSARRHHQSRGRIELRHPAVDDRQHTRRCFRSAHRLHHLHFAQSVSRRSRGRSEISVRSGSADRIYVTSSSGQQVPLSTLVNTVIKAAPIVVNHQGMFPVRDDLVQFETWRRAWRRRECDPERSARTRQAGICWPPCFRATRRHSSPH